VTHPRMLARQFAATLGELRDTWELAYWRGGSLPRVAAQGIAHDGATTTTSTSTTAEGVVAAARVEGHLPVVGANDGLREQAREWSPATKLEYLRRRNVGDCQRCGLARTRTNIVFGVGDPSAQIMFVGEAPGADEDRVGEPFVGRAGQRLDAWITAIGLRRDQVYIANVLKCRPPGNRDPKPDEVDKCSPFLQAQIRAIAPKVIVALGRHAAMLLSRREDLSMKAMRGARLFYEVGGAGAAAHPIPIVATYHPAYVLRQEGSGEGPDAEQLVLSDLHRALDLVRANGGAA
jgi:uracil-DNA glycosylase